MRLMIGLALALAGSLPCLAQNWEVGPFGGFGFCKDATIANGSGTAKAGVGPRFTLGVSVGHRVNSYLDAEFRYALRDGDTELLRSPLAANMDGDAQVFDFGLLLHTRRKWLGLQPYVVGGTGMKLYRATGVEYTNPPQPLSDFALLKKGNQGEPIIAFGGGVKRALGRRTLVRLDVRDVITPFPESLIHPTPPSTVKGWLHDFVPTIGLGFRF